ncbi:MAG: mycofactocin-associated electron transfer flavoprotein alpha subunit [Ilumatobacteraceae bacterium]|jgi:electron transfer flavoprotein alpha subunit|nr:mycofactocin-associated electron transfer flavoprotein alpha subunit [Ilumatobacteraceae bacterium]MDP4936778.1 mycofactocin-associated electron transfer flavoprotein alpha subunit [Ilumatobacteraceae bacterium]MDP5114244.1 mycofactocin-associated electron transfer flavoprotein alpha subunit [Ilumatobacteraceae bacterium]
MIAVIPVRDGVAPAGADEAICEASGQAIIIGSGTPTAAETLRSFSTHLWLVETDIHAANVVAALENINRSHDSLILPGTPDGRDLAPHLAHAFGRSLYAGSISISDDKVSVSRNGGLSIVDFTPHQAFVATLQIGIRGTENISSNPTITPINIASVSRPTSSVTSIAVLPPDASTMDLSEAPRIIGGGAGLESGDRFIQLQNVATALDASMGVTRVITDRGWADHERQIGTTGVVVDPDLYIAFGISGAVQHTSGLGQPEHIISVNTDAHCPMMQMADIAIVTDANAVLEELAQLMHINNEVGAA